MEIVAVGCKPWTQPECSDVQCQVRKEVFESRNKLFEHLEEECSHGQLLRTTAGSHHKQLKSVRRRKMRGSRVSAVGRVAPDMAEGSAAKTAVESRVSTVEVFNMAEGSAAKTAVESRVSTVGVINMAEGSAAKTAVESRVSTVEVINMAEGNAARTAAERRVSTVSRVAPDTAEGNAAKTAPERRVSTVSRVAPDKAEGEKSEKTA
jgi:hypothetical protein